MSTGIKMRANIIVTMYT